MMRRVWQPVRRGMLVGLAAAGSLRRAGMPILAYHAIDNSGAPTSTPPDLFQRQLHYLAERGYQSLTLAEAYRRVQHDDLPPRPVVFTFDDGYRDFIDVALPLLRARRFVATVFVVSGYVGRASGWKRHPAIPELPLATWDELRAARDCGTDLQAHSASHPHLSRIPRAAAREEIVCCKQHIEDRLGGSVDFLACPYGDFDDHAISVARQAGFRGVCCGDFGVERLQPKDWFRLRRLDMDSIRGDAASKMAFFRASLRGTAQWYVAARESLLEARGGRRPQPWELD